MKQTAVKFLEKICNDRGYHLMSEYFEQAKEMEKQQIIDAFGVGCQVESTRLIGYQEMSEQYYNKTYKGNDEQPKFKVGDKLEALEWDKEENNLEYVTITSINMENKVYHWEAKLNWDIGGTLSSGYYFHEAKAYEPKKIL